MNATPPSPSRPPRIALRVPAGCRSFRRWFVDSFLRILGLVLLLSGCARQELSFSYTGSDEGYGQAAAAADAWNVACGAGISVERGGDGIPLEEVVAESLGPGTIEHEGSEAAGQTKTLDGDVTRVRFLRSPRGEEVLMHELGHALGIVTHAQHGIMAHVSVRTPEDVRVTPYECGLLP